MQAFTAVLTGLVNPPHPPLAQRTDLVMQHYSGSTVLAELSNGQLSATTSGVFPAVTLTPSSYIAGTTVTYTVAIQVRSRDELIVGIRRV